MTQQQRDIIAKDRMKYKTNSLSANLCYLALLLNVLYFMAVYKINNNELYTPMMGASVIYNLLFMLLTFLASTKVKTYDKKFAITILAVGAIQIARIFILPTTILDEGYAGEASQDQFNLMVIYLCVSCVALVVAGIVALVRATRRERFIAAVESGEIDISFISARDSRRTHG